MKRPLLVNKWPGSHEVVNKVPTQVCYRAGYKRYRWGFECPAPSELERTMDVIEYFKLYLDPALLGRRIDLENFPIYQEENVQMWWEDYLKALYGHIAEHINTALREYGLGDWKSNRIEYIFSIPTTWAGSRVIEVFRKIVKKAGFGEYENHSVHIKLTEAEAAAVYTAKSSNHQESVHQRSQDIGSASDPSSGGSSLKEGDILLICDSGGGTTVLCLAT